ncbi:Assembly [Fragilaria crotonensis]|nr:Assembly [Fragilaria crotonensis]
MSISRVTRKILARNHQYIAVSHANRFYTAESEQQANNVVYEAPFSGLTTRLKAVSLGSAALGAFGIPILIHLYSGDVPAIGQYALGGTTMLAACGSTVGVNFCFAPYVHSLEMVPVRKCQGKNESVDEINCRPAQQQLVKATWRNFLLLRHETVFDPAVDVSEYKGIRPFCNFVAKGVPLFIHPELLLDDALRKQLLGDKTAKKYNMPSKEQRSRDDDELF